MWHARNDLGIWFAVRLCVPYVCWGLVTQLHDVGYVGTLSNKLDKVTQLHDVGYVGTRGTNVD